MQMSSERYGVEDNEKKESLKVECIRCGSIMDEISVCHLRCSKCGAELDCSDKGNFW